MTDIKGILLVPEEGDLHDLLAEGPCGARPPWAARCATCQRWVGGDGEGLTCHCFPGPAIPNALVLAWDGEPVWQGIDAVNRVSCTRISSTAFILDGVGDAALGGGYVLGVLAGYPRSQPDLPGSIVLLDAEGREVSNE